MTSSTRTSSPRPLKPTQVGIPAVDALSIDPSPTLHGYVGAVSQYIHEANALSASASKEAQIALSAGLGRALRDELVRKAPDMRPHAGELKVAGALRAARADVSEAHILDGLRLAVEIKPVNLAVGRALWNRVGDVRTFAVNIHLKFPFAVVGGVLAVPTWEWATRSNARANRQRVGADDVRGVDHGPRDANDLVDEHAGKGGLAEDGPPALYRKPTTHLLDRLVRQLQRTRRRETDADAPHLLEAIAVIVYDPDTGELSPDLPPAGSGLRWDEFVTALADAYDVRFEN